MGPMARKRAGWILALAGAVLYYTDAQGQYSTIEDQEVIRQIVACINGIELEGDDPFLQ